MGATVHHHSFESFNAQRNWAVDGWFDRLNRESSNDAIDERGWATRELVVRTRWAQA